MQNNRFYTIDGDRGRGILKSVADKLDIATVLIHHTRKQRDHCRAQGFSR